MVAHADDLIVHPLHVKKSKNSLSVERCLSGRKSTIGNRVCLEKGIEGSNPSLSASLRLSGPSGSAGYAWLAPADEVS
jgi:hypothetical protein